MALLCLLYLRHVLQTRLFVANPFLEFVCLTGFWVLEATSGSDNFGIKMSVVTRKGSDKAVFNATIARNQKLGDAAGRDQALIEVFAELSNQPALQAEASGGAAAASGGAN